MTVRRKGNKNTFSGVAEASTPKKATSSTSSAGSINFSPILRSTYSPQSISDITPTDENPSPNAVKNMSILLNKNWSLSWMSDAGNSPTPTMSHSSPTQSPSATQSLPATQSPPATQSLAASQSPPARLDRELCSMLEAVPVDRNYLKDTPPPAPGFGSVVNRIKNCKIPYKPKFTQ